MLADLGDDNELLYWIAFDQLEPLSDPWLQTGILASTFANCHTTKGKTFKPSDFMPTPEKVKKAQTSDDMKAVLEQLTKKEIRGDRLK